VRKKNNWVPDHKDYYARPQSEVQIERTEPGRGYRHVVTVAQLRRFLEILPDWDELAVGLKAISIWRGNEQRRRPRSSSSLRLRSPAVRRQTVRRGLRSARASRGLARVRTAVRDLITA
jgi:hypothetical protein